jgi:hypothetical protein
MWTGGEWERIGEVRKRTDVPLHAHAKRLLVEDNKGEAYTHYQSVIMTSMKSVTKSSYMIQMPHTICPLNKTTSSILYP